MICGRVQFIHRKTTAHSYIAQHIHFQPTFRVLDWPHILSALLNPSAAVELTSPCSIPRTVIATLRASWYCRVELAHKYNLSTRTYGCPNAPSNVKLMVLLTGPYCNTPAGCNLLGWICSCTQGRSRLGEHALSASEFAPGREWYRRDDKKKHPSSKVARSVWQMEESFISKCFPCRWDRL